MSFEYLFKKAERILKSYLNSVKEEEDDASKAKKRQIYEEYLKNEAKRRTYQKHQDNFNQRAKQERQAPPSSKKTQLDFYSVLGVKPNASNDEIKKAYKTIIVQYHPDKTTNLGIEIQNLAKKKTQEINEAYNQIKKIRNF